MKISLKDKDINNESLSLKKVIKRGIAFGLAAGISLSLVADIETSDELDTMMEPVTLEVSSEDVNDMNIIINDNDCSDVFFNEVCNKLKEDGLEFTATSNNEGINTDNSVVITLDQQYSSGEATIIFAPYDNTRLGYSDSLTLAMQSAFLQNGFFADDLATGKLGFRDDGNGNVTRIVPTDTEEAIDSNYDTSFVTISFGTSNVNAEWVAKSIENGLARQNYYLKNYDAGNDLLYRSSDGEDIKVVADYFDSNVHELSAYNNLSGKEELNSQVIINPSVNSMTVFNKNIVLNIDEVKTRAY